MPARTFSTLMRRLSKAGFKGEFVRAAVLPDWWSDECADDEALLPDIEFRVARFLDRSVEAIRSVDVALGTPSYPRAQLRNMSNVARSRVEPAIHAALRVAEAACRNLKTPRATPVVPTTALEWRSLLLKTGPFPSLDNVVSDLWARGIPVLHVEVLPSPKFQGMACIVEGRPVVLLAHDTDVPARSAFFVIHEVGHITNGDCAEYAPVVDETDDTDNSDSERKADAFAFTVLNGRPRPYDISGDGFREIAESATKMEAKHQVDAAHLILAWARQDGSGESHAEATKALNALWKRATTGKRTLRRHFDANVDVARANETDRGLLKCLFNDPERDAGTR